MTVPASPFSAEPATPPISWGTLPSPSPQAASDRLSRLGYTTEPQLRFWIGL